MLDDIAWPPGYRYSFGGSTKNMNESFQYAVGALALAIVFIYMILASQFKSFLQPLALMSSLPLTLIGVVLTLLMFRSTLNMFSIIGIVMLMGLVTKNAILLVDFAIRVRRRSGEHGLRATPRRRANEALLLPRKVRLRPILMTTLAMVFGMVPLAFALSEGSEQRAPMGQAVIGGVITSSLLTLVVVPVIYCYLDDLAAWAKRQLRAGALPAATSRQPREIEFAPTSSPRNAMNIEQARFNMIEQQIRPWDVLDSGVLSLLAVVKREDFVPPRLPRAGLRRHRGAAARTASACWRRRSRRACCRNSRVHKHERVLEIGAGSGYMAALLAHQAQQVITLEIDPELARIAARQPAPRRRAQRDAWSTPTARAACPADGPFDVIVLSGSVAEVPPTLLAQLKVGGRLAAIVGHEPVMRAVLLTRRRQARARRRAARAVRHRRPAPARLRRAERFHF